MARKKIFVSVAAIIAVIVSTNIGSGIRTNEAGLQVMLNAEQCTRNAYYDSVHIPTNGCGNTHNVSFKKLLTDNQIASQVVTNIKEAEICVNQKLNGANMNDNQFSATVSLVYNVGCATATQNKDGSYTWLRRYAVAGNWSKYCPRFLAFNRAGGKVLRGLNSRREAERDLCEKPVDK